MKIFVFLVSVSVLVPVMGFAASDDSGGEPNTYAKRFSKSSFVENYKRLSAKGAGWRQEGEQTGQEKLVKQRRRWGGRRPAVRSSSASVSRGGELSDDVGLEERREARFSERKRGVSRYWKKLSAVRKEKKKRRGTRRRVGQARIYRGEVKEGNLDTVISVQ